MAVIKGQVIALGSPVQKALSTIRVNHTLQIFFRMMFYKPLISLVAALAATSTAVASAIPERRDDPVPIPASQCDTGTLSCCDQLTNSNDPAAIAVGALLGIILGHSIGVGLTCTPISDAEQW
ncbi:hypothetical protein B0F90DRAFT_1825571 [Multifurca ochricompacta]|uniref:Hydrophobin n=1 Tax=Multifurca ochricompacta TaxID=376703 RepID=A0AAD4LT59_9AGAM|nr:hypothetical protein B0F90DRAFT_1825571 [Multifurca ochricompacta]